MSGSHLLPIVVVAALLLVIPPQLADKPPLTFYASMLSGEKSGSTQEAGDLVSGASDDDAALSFTSGIGDDNMPLDRLAMIRLSHMHGQKIFGHVYWPNLDRGEYDYKGEWYDGDNNQLFVNRFKLKPVGAGWISYTWIRVNNAKQKPGRWRFKVFLNEEPVLEGHLDVFR